jgi:excisionase family DNA binding protein
VTPVLPRGRKLLRVLTDAPPALLTVREVAQRLRVSRPTVYSLCERCLLAHYRVSNSIRIRPEDLDAYLGEQGR